MFNKKFYTKQNVEELRFYQVPKVLVENDLYRDLGLSEKLTYGILLDRTQLSLKNNWIDEDGYVYFVFSGESLGKILNVHEKTARRYITNLKKYGLLEEKRLGRGKANRMYLVKPEYIKSDVRKSYPQESSSEKNVEKSYPQDQTIENNKKEQKVPSRRNKRFPLEGTKGSPNDTNISDTDFSDTQSINQYNTNKKENIKNKKDRLNDKTIINKLHKKYNSDTITKSIQKANQAKNNGTIINNLYKYLEKICEEVEKEDKILNNKFYKKINNKRKTNFHMLEQRSDNYSAEELEEIARKKRKEYINKLKKTY